MSVWIPEKIYNVLPLLYSLAGILILVTTQQVAFVTFALGLIGYSSYLCWMRFQ